MLVIILPTKRIQKTTLKEVITQYMLGSSTRMENTLLSVSLDGDIFPLFGYPRIIRLASTSRSKSFARQLIIPKLL